MPVTTETLWNMRRTNVVFGVASVLMLVSFFWMMKHDMDRKWRGFQTQYFNARSGLAHLTYLAYLSPEEQEKLAELEAAVEAARAGRDTEVIETTQEQIERLSGELEGVSLEYGNTNAALGVVVFHLNEKQSFDGISAVETQARKAEYESMRTRLNTLKARKDAIEDELRVLRDRVKSMEEPVVVATREIGRAHV